MRGDYNNKESYNTLGARTQTEIVETQQCFGVNTLKLARYTNFIGGLALCIISVFNIWKSFAFTVNIVGLVALSFF